MRDVFVRLTFGQPDGQRASVSLTREEADALRVYIARALNPVGAVISDVVLAARAVETSRN